MVQAETATKFDEKKAERFAETALDILNKGAVAILLSVGHRTGLLDTFATLPPSGSQEIADAAGLNERYVREWLGGLVTGGVVEYNPADKTYTLPPEHAAFLTRAASPNNLGAFMQYIPMLGTVEDKIIESFKHGGGVPYADFPRFQQTMAEDSGQTVIPVLIDQIVPLVPGLTEKLERGIDVLDVGCGSGRALNLLAETFPNSRFVGVDISPDGLAYARAEADEKGLTNVRFEDRDAAQLWFEEQFDLVTTFDAVHDQRDPVAVVECIYRALKPGGAYLMQDIASSVKLENNYDLPLGPLLYTVSTFHCMTVSLAVGGAGYGTMWGQERAIELLRDTGFEVATVTQLKHDPQNSFYVSFK